MVLIGVGGGGRIKRLTVNFGNSQKLNSSRDLTEFLGIHILISARGRETGHYEHYKTGQSLACGRMHHRRSHRRLCPLSHPKKEPEMNI